jgi:hypothetical protein
MRKISLNQFDNQQELRFLIIYNQIKLKNIDCRTKYSEFLKLFGGLDVQIKFKTKRKCKTDIKLFFRKSESKCLYSKYVLMLL